LSLSSQIEPRNFEEAKGHPESLKAMESEIKALEFNRTWEITDLPPNKTPIGCKWVYKIKRRVMGRLRGTRHVLLRRNIHNGKE